MIQISDNGVVSVFRGDSFTLPISVDLGTTLNLNIYTLQSGDKLYLGIEEPECPFEMAIVKKVATASEQDSSGTISFFFVPDDTLYLVPGTYYYEVKLQKMLTSNESGESGEDFEVDTIMQRTKFIIME